MPDPTTFAPYWRGEVHSLMRQGYGWEDCAVKLSLPPVIVEAERDRLEQLGVLDRLYGVRA